VQESIGAARHSSAWQTAAENSHQRF